MYFIVAQSINKNTCSIVWMRTQTTGGNLNGYNLYGGHLVISIKM